MYNKEIMNNTTILNYLSADRFMFNIEELPNTSFTVQDHNLPGVSLPAPKQATPIVNIPLMGDKLVNETLRVTFIITEGLENWLEARGWLVSNANPVSRPSAVPLGATRSTITAYDSSNNPIGSLEFIGCVPVSLTGIESTVKINETTTLTSTLEMEFESFDFVPVK